LTVAGGLSEKKNSRTEKKNRGSRKNLRFLGERTLGDSPKRCETRNKGQIWTHGAPASQTKVVWRRSGDGTVVHETHAPTEATTLNSA